MAATPRLKKRGTGTVGGAGMRIEGLDDLLKKLESLPQRLRRKPLLKALREGGKITLNVAKNTAPVGVRKLKSIRTDLFGKSPRVMRKRLKDSLWLKTWPQPRDKNSKPSTAIIGLNRCGITLVKMALWVSGWTTPLNPTSAPMSGALRPTTDLVA